MTTSERPGDGRTPADASGGPPPPPRVRRATGLANDERILDAAIEAVAATGADALSLRDVAARAGFTYGALYGRYANAPDLLAGLWERRLETEFERLVAAAVAWDATTPPATAIELCRSTPARRAMVETMIVSARIDDLAEVVPDGCRAALTLAGLLPLASRDGLAERRLGLVALALGSIAHAPLEGGFDAVAPDAATWLSHGAWQGPPPTPVPPAPVSFTSPGPSGADPAAGDDTYDERDGPLLDATLRVIARSGFAGATLRRIGRATGRTSRVVYHAYGSHHRLLHEIIRRVAERTRAAAARPGESTDPLARSALAAGILGPDAHLRRRLALEFNLGAVHDPASGPLVAASDLAGYEARADRLAARGSREHASLVGLGRALRNVQFGLALIEETAGGLEAGDWRHAVGSLLRNGLAANGVPEGT